MNVLPARFATGTRILVGEEKSHSAAHGAHRVHPRRLWYLLLALPYVGLLWPPLYTRTEPTLLNFPFFYWYQFLWVPMSAVLTGITYLATGRR